MGARGFIRNIFILYVCYRLLKVWLFHAEFTFFLGILVLILFTSAIWVLYEMVFVPKGS